jgi:hypothetical protein
VAMLAWNTKIRPGIDHKPVHGYGVKVWNLTNCLPWSKSAVDMLVSTIQVIPAQPWQSSLLGYRLRSSYRRATCCRVSSGCPLFGLQSFCECIDVCLLISFAHANYPTNTLAYSKVLPLILRRQRQVATAVPVSLDA